MEFQCCKDFFLELDARAAVGSMRLQCLWALQVSCSCEVRQTAPLWVLSYLTCGNLCYFPAAGCSCLLGLYVVSDADGQLFVEASTAAVASYESQLV